MLHLAGRRIVRPGREVDGLHRRFLVRRTRLREESLLDAVRVRDDDRTPRSRPCGLAYGEGDMGRCSSRPR